jgi:hypothetical protein
MVSSLKDLYSSVLKSKSGVITFSTFNAEDSERPRHSNERDGIGHATQHPQQASSFPPPLRPDKGPNSSLRVKTLVAATRTSQPMGGAGGSSVMGQQDSARGFNEKRLPTAEGDIVLASSERMIL